MTREPLFRIKDLSFTPFFISRPSLSWRKRRRSWNNPGTLCLHMNNCKLTSQFTGHNYLSFLTAVSWEDWRLGFPPLFDNCPPKNTKQWKRKKVDFFLLWRKRQKVEKNSRNVSFQLFCDSRDINNTQESCFTLYRRQILKISDFSWEKGALFSGFHNGDWKLKKGLLFSVSSIEYK